MSEKSARNYVSMEYSRESIFSHYCITLFGRILKKKKKKKTNFSKPTFKPNNLKNFLLSNHFDVTNIAGAEVSRVSKDDLLIFIEFIVIMLVIILRL